MNAELVFVCAAVFVFGAGVVAWMFLGMLAGGRGRTPAVLDEQRPPTNRVAGEVFEEGRSAWYPPAPVLEVVLEERRPPTNLVATEAFDDVVEALEQVEDALRPLRGCRTRPGCRRGARRGSSSATR